MGRNKMEMEFSEKLNQREIKPSAASWDRLDAMLAVAEQEKPVRRLNWLYIAASVLAVALMVTFLFNRGPEATNETIIVQKEEPTGPVDSITAPFDTPQPEIAATKSTGAIKSSKSTIVYVDKQIAEIVTNPESSDRQNSVINQNQINQSNQTGNPTADELLAMAQSNANSDDVKKSVKVNANGLLSEVDGSQNLTFRQKVLHKVGKNYQNVKVALANRNIEDENH